MATLTDFINKTRLLLMRERAISSVASSNLEISRNLGVLIGNGLAAFDPRVNRRDDSRWVDELFAHDCAGWTNQVYRSSSEKEAVRDLADTVVRVIEGRSQHDSLADIDTHKYSSNHLDYILQRYEVFDKMLDLTIDLRLIRHQLDSIPAMTSPEGRSYLRLQHLIVGKMITQLAEPKTLAMLTIGFIEEIKSEGGNMDTVLKRLDLFESYRKPFVAQAKQRGRVENQTKRTQRR